MSAFPIEIFVGASVTNGFVRIQDACMAVWHLAKCKENVDILQVAIADDNV
jgi:hypothetical protein